MEVELSHRAYEQVESYLLTQEKEARQCKQSLVGKPCFEQQRQSATFPSFLVVRTSSKLAKNLRQPNDKEQQKWSS